MAMTVKELEERLNGMISKGLDPVSTEVKGLKEQIEELKKVPSQPIHTKGHVVDDGHLSEVGAGLYKLKGGTVINTNTIWRNDRQVMKRTSGMFEHLGEETEEFFSKVREGWKRKGACVISTPDWDGLTTKDPLAMTSTVSGQDDSSAALFIPEDVRYALLQFAPPGTIVWPRAQVWPMVSDNINWPKLVQTLESDSEDFFGNVVLGWTEEGGEKPDTRPTFDTMRLTCHELSAYTEITDTLLEDSAINLGNLITQLFQGAYWHGTDKVFLTGMGTTRPLGVLNDPNINSVNRVVANRLVYEDLLNMSTEHPSLFDRDSVWFMSKACFNSLRKQKDDSGQPVIQLGEGYNNFGEGVAGYALGYPIVMSDYKTKALGTTGDVVLGNWKHYFVGERKAISIEMSKHAVFRNNRTAFRCSARIGGMPEEPKAFTVLNATADATQAS